MTRALDPAAALPDSPVIPGLVAVVIVGFNEKHVVAACLSSWKVVTYEPLRLFYVDNRSADGALECVRVDFPDVVAVDSGGNLGYCGGNNVGIRMAIEAGAEFVLILNPDTVVFNPAFVRTLVDHLRLHPEVGKVGPRVFLREVGEVQNTVMAWPSIGGSLFARFRSVNVSATMHDPGDVDVLNGCCVLVRAAALRDVGLYDEEYFAYGDEAEWDWRAERAGWKRHFVPVDSIIHRQKQSGYDFASRANFLIKRNTALWFLNAGKPVALLCWITATTAIAAARAVAAPFRGQSFVRYLAFLGTLVRAYVGLLGRLVTGRRITPESLRTADA